jgi:hypothetical protein
MREETHDGRVVRVAVKPGWNIPASPADVPAGDRIATVLWWWATVPLERGTEPPWLTEAASVPGLEEITGS